MAAVVPPVVIPPVAAPPVVIAPLLGGLLNGHPWTGGKPANVDRDVSLNTEPASPACFRPTDPDKAMKIWNELTKPSSTEPRFKRSDALSAFERHVVDHLEATGCDGVIYMTPPYNPTEFTNIVTHHSHVTLEMVITYWSDRIAADEVDTYEMANLRFFKTWLLASIDPELAILVLDKLSPGGLGPEVWMLLVMEIRSESFLYYESLKTTLKSLKLSQFPGDNVCDFTAKWVKVATELQVANAFDYHFLVNLITELTETTVQLFVIAMAALHTRVLQYTNQLRLLGPAAQAAMMGAANAISYRSICMEADNLYRSLLENGKWTPAIVTSSVTNPPEFHAITTMDQFNALVQKLNVGGAAGGRGRDPAKVTCFNCRQLGHYSNKCPHPKVNNVEGANPIAMPNAMSGPTGVPNWKRTPPVAGQIEVKEVTLADGTVKKYHWCARCGRYTPSHGTSNHTDPNPRAPGAHPPMAPPSDDPGPAQANVAVHWEGTPAWN